MLQSEFLKRVFEKVPQGTVSSFFFKSWKVPGKPTEEGVGILPVSGADPEKLLARVMDVDHYLGNIDHVVQCRGIADPRFEPPGQVRFYQRIKIPLLGAVQHELVLTDAGEHQGYRVATWQMLRPETAGLNPKEGARSQYSDGAWLVAPGVVGYALSSAPRRSDVGFLKWKALTKGADVGAATVLKGNIEGMARWAAR